MSALTVIQNGTLTIGQIANSVASAHVFEDYTRRKSANTLRRHRADLRLFMEYLYECRFYAPPLPTGEAMTHDPGLWQGMTWGIVKGFVEWMLSAGYAIGAINNRLSTVKVYAMLAVKAGMVEVQEGYLIKSISGYGAGEGRNVDTRRDTHRLGRKKAEATGITFHQAELLKAQPDTPVGRRDSLIMHLLLEHGLRVSELSSLKVGDFDCDTGMLSFYRPKVSEAAIPHLLKNGSLRVMLAYLDSDATGAGYLLRGSRKGGRLTGPGMAEQNINARVRQLGQTIGLDNLSPHDCRHYCATRLARSKSIKELMDFFGWTSASTAMRYIDSTKFVEGD